MVIMWFAGVLPSSGHPHLIPWRYTTEDAPRQIDSAVGSHFRTEPYSVRNPEDIKDLESNPSAHSAVVLRPDGPHLRDEGFLERLGTAVRNLGLRLDLEGSPLSHAFYVLKRTGAQVACVDPINPQAVKLRFGKLVRDRIPVQIQRHGETAQTFVLPKDELLDVLKRKLVEEGLEVLAAGKTDSLREEIADVYEVIRALCRALGCTVEDVQRDADRKKRRLGGFGSGIVLVETEDTPLIFVRPEGGLFEKPRSKKISPTPNSIAAAGRRRKAQADRVVVPLVPPVPSRVRGASRVELRQFGLTVRIKYQDKTIEVFIEPTVPRISSAQLVLPFEW